jgi:predicted nucleic acid-binding protein
MIDPKLLPKTAMIDTGVLIRGLGERPEHPESLMCREFFDGMVSAGRQILIAAPTLAEYLRKTDAAAPPPQFAEVLVVAFDDRAARFLGERFTEATLHELAQEMGLPVFYFKYDAMIVSCAKVYKVDCLVTLDGRRQNGNERGMLRLARKADVAAVHPVAFQSSQGSLFDLG